MSRIIRLRPNTQAYLRTLYDGYHSKHDIEQMTYNYQNPALDVAVPVGSWSMDDDEGNMRTDAIGGRNLEEWYSSVPSAEGKLANCAAFYTANEALRWDSSDAPYSANIPFPLGSTKLTFAVWLKRGGSESNCLFYHSLNDSNAETVTSIGFAWQGNNLIAFLHSTEPSADIDLGTQSYDWHLAICWWDQSEGVLYAQIDNGTVQSVSAPGVTWTDPIGAIQFTNTAWALANGAFVDQSNLYNFILTVEQREYLWNDGNGQSPY